METFKHRLNHLMRIHPLTYATGISRLLCFHTKTERKVFRPLGTRNLSLFFHVNQILDICNGLITDFNLPSG